MKGLRVEQRGEESKSKETRMGRQDSTAFHVKLSFFAFDPYAHKGRKALELHKVNIYA